MIAECMSTAINHRELSLTNVTPLLCHDDHQLATVGRLALQIVVAYFEWSELDVAANPYSTSTLYCEPLLSQIVVSVSMHVRIQLSSVGL